MQLGGFQGVSLVHRGGPTPLSPACIWPTGCHTAEETAAPGFVWQCCFGYFILFEGFPHIKYEIKVSEISYDAAGDSSVDE